MIEKTVTYINLFTKEPETKTLYFHIYEETLIAWLLEEGLNEVPTKIQEFIDNEDWPSLMDLFRKMIEKGYGNRRGNEFEQTPKITAAFMGTAAYNALFLELLSDEKSAREFFNGMFPPELMATAQKAVDLQNSPGAQTQNIKATPGVGAGVPQVAMTPERAVELSGLQHPYGKDQELLPWAFREPTGAEQTAMTKAQMMECFKRKTAGWEAPESL
jgi:hypothetical protein